MRSLTGYAQVAHKVGLLGLRRTRFARSGFIIEYRVAYRSTHAPHVRPFAFSHSREALKHYYGLC
jgi:hypothetical protein